MSSYPLFADAAWLRLGIVGLDILAVVLTVRLCAAVTAWWRTLRPPGHHVPPTAHARRRGSAQN